MTDSLVIPIIAYGSLGMETLTVTAYEARDLRSIRKSTQVIAYVVLILYLFCAIGEYLNVEWTDPGLPSKYMHRKTSSDDVGKHTTKVGAGAIIVVAAYNAGQKKIAGLLNGCIIFSALSAANSSLYIASRVLYGMTRDIRPRSRFAIFRSLGSVWNPTGVPVRALAVSFLSFVWLPFLRLKGGIAIEDVGFYHRQRLSFC
jgi:amino acid transporter